jgi:small subunit ribosomal protein S6
LKPYEAIIIFKPEIPEEKIDVSIAKFEKKLRDSGGADIVTAKWGTRKLASMMKKAKKATEGYYILINFNGEGDTPNALRDLLNVSEEIIRYTVMIAKPAHEAEPREREEKVEIEPSMIMQTELPTLPSTGEQPSEQGDIPA